MTTRAVKNGTEGTYDILWGAHVKVVVGTSIAVIAASVIGMVNLYAEVSAARTSIVALREELRSFREEYRGKVAEARDDHANFITRAEYLRHDHHGTADMEGGPVYRGKQRYRSLSELKGEAE